MHIFGSRIEREIEIYGTDLANKTKCMSAKSKSKSLYD
jgi:hypothetical protein